MQHIRTRSFLSYMSAVTRLQDLYFVEIWARGGSRREAMGIRTAGQKRGCLRSKYGYLGSSRNLSFQERVGNVAVNSCPA